MKTRKLTSLLLLILLMFTSIISAEEVKGRRVFVSLDTSGSMLRGLNSALVQDLRFIIRNIVLEGNYNLPVNATVVSDQSLVFRGQPLLKQGDRFSIIHYGDTIKEKVVSSSYSEQSLLLKYLPDSTGNFRNMFQDQTTHTYLPEMYVLDKYIANPQYDYFWLNISDSVLDPGLHKMDTTRLRRWDALHEGIKIFVVFRAKLSNGIFLTFKKISEDTELKLKMSTGTNENTIALYRTNRLPNKRKPGFVSKPFSIRSFSGTMPTIRVQRIELQGRDKNGKKILLEVDRPTQSKMERLVLEGDTDPDDVNKLTDTVNTVPFVRMVYYNSEGREMRHLFRRVKVINLSEKADADRTDAGQQKSSKKSGSDTENESSTMGVIILIVFLLAILAGAVYLLVNNMDSGSTEFTFSIPEAPNPGAQSIELEKGDVVAFHGKTADDYLSKAYEKPQVPDCYITMENPGKGRFTFTDTNDPERDDEFSVPADLELINTTGKAVVVRIEVAEDYE